MTLQINPHSYRQLMTNLSTLPRKVGLRVFRVALNAWGGIVKQEQKTRAKRGATGLLRKSPTVKVKIPDASFNAAHHGKPAYVMVGPGRNVVGAVAGGKKLSDKKALKRVLGGGKVQTRRPSRYAHLVERGIAGTKRITPEPFVEPSIRAGETEGMAKLASKLESGIAAAAASLPKG